MGAKKLTYNVPVSTPTKYLTTSKLHWDRFLSTQFGKYLIVHVKNFYLNNPMMKNEYYKIAITIIYQERIEKYDLNNKKIDACIYVRFHKGIYGLVQARIIAHEALKEYLKPYGNTPARITK